MGFGSIKSNVVNEFPDENSCTHDFNQMGQPFIMPCG
jgi:hypothetical protein